MGANVEIERVVDAPIEKVWAVITDIDNASQTLSGVTSVERLTAGPYGVGTRWRETRSVAGREATEEMWVAESDAPRRTVIRSDNADAAYVASFELESAAGGTRVRYVFGAQPAKRGSAKKLLLAVTEPLAKVLTKRMMAKDLEDIARVAEGESS